MQHAVTQYCVLCSELWGLQIISQCISVREVHRGDAKTLPPIPYPGTGMILPWLSRFFMITLRGQSGWWKLLLILAIAVWYRMIWRYMIWYIIHMIPYHLKTQKIYHLSSIAPRPVGDYQSEKKRQTGRQPGHLARFSLVALSFVALSRALYPDDRRPRHRDRLFPTLL